MIKNRKNLVKIHNEQLQYIFYEDQPSDNQDDQGQQDQPLITSHSYKNSTPQ